MASCVSGSMLFIGGKPNRQSNVVTRDHFSSNIRRTKTLRIASHYSRFEVKDLSYRPPGTEHTLLDTVSFSLPEKRYFVADNVLDEVTFGWPRQKGDLHLKERLALKLQRAINWVGLNGIALDKDAHSLSGGYKRRLALTIQLVQIPDLLLLDEPLAGLDWKARTDVVKLLKNLKKDLTVLVVSHDLKLSSIRNFFDFPRAAIDEFRPHPVFSLQHWCKRL